MWLSWYPSTDVEPDQSSSSLQTRETEKVLVSLIEAQKLHSKALVYLRKRHHSQAQRHKGNERDRVDPEELQVAIASTKKDGRLDPSACSKIIAVHMKDQNTISSGAERRHRWNIHVKLNMAGLMTRTSLLGYKALQGLFDGGIISTQNPIKPGKFVIIIKNHVSFIFAVGVKQFEQRLKLWLLFIVGSLFGSHSGCLPASKWKTLICQHCYLAKRAVPHICSHLILQSRFSSGAFHSSRQRRRLDLCPSGCDWCGLCFSTIHRLRLYFFGWGLLLSPYGYQRDVGGLWCSTLDQSVRGRSLKIKVDPKN